MDLLRQMDENDVAKNEITYSSAISACEKGGNWRQALDLLKMMKDKNIMPTAIAYNAGEFLVMHSYFLLMCRDLCTSCDLASPFSQFSFAFVHLVATRYFSFATAMLFICPPTKSHIRLREGKYSRVPTHSEAISMYGSCPIDSHDVPHAKPYPPPHRVVLLITGTEPLEGFGNIRGDETRGSSPHRGNILCPNIGVREGKNKTPFFLSYTSSICCDFVSQIPSLISLFFFRASSGNSPSRSSKNSRPPSDLTSLHTPPPSRLYRR